MQINLISKNEFRRSNFQEKKINKIQNSIFWWPN